MERLKQLRESRNLLQKDIAEFLGINRTTYVKYEKGTNEPSNETLLKLADFFDVSTDYLLGRVQTSYTKHPLTEKQKNVIRLAEQFSDDQIEKVIEYANFLKSQEKKSDAYIAAFGGNIQVPDDDIDTPLKGREALDKYYDEEIKRKNKQNE